ncbi:DUF4253 domain-containing protein [Oleomonas cavernae]|uniref:DUF4253 domain-containing protein n=1 Tax=Oleomonas cavernae TaxID=2320859 RepID=A0A418WCX7_9PROT|nr:DUF4253 domain-containing protein [Oleomonas cavernae]RJF87840.1 DUF4253 domain-containing protein [Oleomonas cavernae]
MQRRTFLRSLSGLGISLAGFGQSRWLGGRRAMAQPRDPEEIQAEIAAAYARLVAALPFERVETTGREAFGRWQQLRDEGRAYPVIIGDDEALDRVAEQFARSSAGSPESILMAATSLRHPQSLIDHLAEAEAQAEAALEELQPLFKAKWEEGIRNGGIPAPGSDQMRRMLESVPILQAPAYPSPGEAHAVPGPMIIADYRGNYYPRVHILLIPAKEMAAVPAFLRLGGWDAYPQPEYQVAALRSWHKRLGAELVCASNDRMDILVHCRPRDESEAMALAREIHVFCPDVVNQGPGPIEDYAVYLMQNDWWNLWWD